VSILIPNPLSLPFGEPSQRLENEEDENVVYGSPKEIYQDLRVIRSLNKAKFPVYLVCSRVTKQNYAMKVFPYKSNQPHVYFKNEIRFTCFQHPHIIRYLYIENGKDGIFNTKDAKISYIIMEYAPHGDFFDFIINYGDKWDEKLARTYFRQLIEGLEYLHQNGVSHMDLKLENLLLGKDYTLKIVDFDLSHFETDLRVISKGTKFYRAPEILQGACNNPKAADIYSAGIVLFTFMTKGILPHSESNLIGGLNFSKLLHNNDPMFWAKHSTENQLLFSEEFKHLFILMTKTKPEDRISIGDIKKSKWYNGPFYKIDELKVKVAGFLNSEPRFYSQ